MLAMKRLGLLTILAASAIYLFACGGGNADTENTLPTPGTQYAGGDLGTQSIFGDPDTPFAAPPGLPFEDLRGIAASSRFVYIADKNAIHLYRSNGDHLNSIISPHDGVDIQGIEVIPEKLNIGNAAFDTGFDPTSPFAGSPVILHNPVPGIGYVTILPPNLDYTHTVEDVINPDLQNLITYPTPGVDQMSPPDDPPAVSPPYIVPTLVDIAVDAFGSILVTDVVYFRTPEGDFDVHGHLAPLGHVGLQVFNRFNNYLLERGASFSTWTDFSEDPPVERIADGWRSYHKGFTTGDAIGYLGNMTVSSSVLPMSTAGIPEFVFALYTGDVFIQGDPESTDGGDRKTYVGRTRMTVSFAGLTPTYRVEPIGRLPKVYDQVFGLMFGEEFAPFPNGLDPDLTQGGPSGMFVNPKDGSLYICDPGNDRIQVYAGPVEISDIASLINLTQLQIQVIGAEIALEPSEVMVDKFDRTFIISHQSLTPLPGQPSNTIYGNIGGTVNHLQQGFPLIGATVTITDGFDTAVVGTNINGDYLFRNLPYGQYLIQGSMPGFEHDQFVATVVPDTTIRVDLNPEFVVATVTGEFRGIVSDSSTQSFLSGVQVTLIGYSEIVETDVGGEFTFSNLAPGSYQAVFTLEDYETITRDIIIVKNEITWLPSIVMDRLPLT